MRIFLRPARPRVLIADIKRIWNGSTSRYKLVFGALSLGITSMIVTGFILQTRWDAMPTGPQLIYAANFPADRTDGFCSGNTYWAPAGAIVPRRTLAASNTTAMVISRMGPYSRRYSTSFIHGRDGSSPS